MSDTIKNPAAETTPTVKGRGAKIPVTFQSLDETYTCDKQLYYVSTAYVINKMNGGSLEWALTTNGNFNYAWNAGSQNFAPAGASKMEVFEIQRGNLGSNPAGLYEIFSASINLYNSVIELQLKFVTTSTWGSDMYANVLLDGVTQTNGWFSDDRTVSFIVKGGYDTTVIDVTFPYGGQFYDDAVFTFSEHF